MLPQTIAVHKRQQTPGNEGCVGPSTQESVAQYPLVDDDMSMVSREWLRQSPGEQQT